MSDPPPVPPAGLSRMGSVDLRELRRAFDQDIAFNAFMGLRVQHVERGRMGAELPFREEFLGDPRRPALHGGVLSMLADTVGGGAVFTLTDPGDRVATIDLRVDYLRPGRSEAIQAEGIVIRVGNRVGVCAITLTHPSTPEAPIAVAKGVYTIRRAGD